MKLAYARWTRDLGVCCYVVLAYAALGGCSRTALLSDSGTVVGAGASVGTGGTTGDGGGGGGYGAVHGPQMVTIPTPDGGAFRIDSTEVTNGQYAEFLAANVPAAGQPAACSWNDSYTPPQGAWPAADPEKPVAWVDWCDAAAFCAWAGKRLCGDIGGGPLSATTLGDPATSEWTYACTAAGSRTYPYGDVYSPSACVTGHYLWPDPTARVGTTPGCTGGFPGLHDMSGNVAEWQNYADGESGKDDGVAWQGGAFDTLASSDLRCVSVTYFNRYIQSGETGIRCCKDAP